MSNLRPNDQRARMAINLIWISLIMEMISLVSDYFQYNLLQAADRGDDISDAALIANDMRQQIVAIVYLIVFIISAVTFIQWFRRAYYNLHTKVSYLSHSEGWAAGSWFVPFVNLYRPYQIMKELYVETGNLLTRSGIAVRNRMDSTLLGSWWTLWIMVGITSQFSFRLSMKAETIGELSVSTMASMIASLLSVPMALVTIRLIRNYAENEEQLAELIPEEEAAEQNIA